MSREALHLAIVQALLKLFVLEFEEPTTFHALVATLLKHLYFSLTRDNKQIYRPV